MTVPSWVQKALLATGVMNLLASVAFLPPAGALRAVFGFPVDSHPLYLATVSMFVGLFGAGYLAGALTGRVDRVFLTIAAIGKLGFFALVAGLWATGALPAQAVFGGSADLLFAALFFKCLYDARPSTAGEPLPLPAR
jgi:hypothetical protein